MMGYTARKNGTNPRGLLGRSLIAAAALAAAQTAFAGGAAAYQVSFDQFVIYKNGGLYVNETFGDGNPPPAAGTTYGGGPVAATYFTAGTWSEAGGRAIADSTNNPEVIVSPYDGDITNRHDALLLSSTGADTTLGLRNDDSFYAMALVDLSSVLDLNDSSYNLRFRDAGSGNTINDEVRIGVRRNDNGTMTVRFGDYDFNAGQLNVLDSDTLQAGHDQILLRLDHGGAGTVSGSYAYVSGGIDISNLAAVNALSFNAMAGSVELFHGENWTRASLAVFETIPGPVPEPAALLVFGAGLAGLAAMRRRRAAR